MIHKLMPLVAAVACFGAAACNIYLPVVPSTQGKAYVASRNLFGNMAMYYCDASSGKPTCTPTDEK